MPIGDRCAREGGGETRAFKGNWSESLWFIGGSSSEVRDGKLLHIASTFETEKERERGRIVQQPINFRVIFDHDKNKIKNNIKSLSSLHQASIFIVVYTTERKLSYLNYYCILCYIESPSIFPI